MSTLVTFHAHPDDEAVGTAGVMAKAAAEGHRVVLVVATRGEEGEVVPGVLSDGEELSTRRVEETHRAAAILGVHRVEFLDHRDSGMMGEPANEHPASFWRADVTAAADELAAILAEESADVLTVYDENGVYGHPDHIQVHRVGILAAELAGTPRVYEETVDRSHVREVVEQAPPGTLPEDFDPAALDELGVERELITTTVDVGDFVDRKRAALRAHTSQIPETSFFLSMPDDVFATVFGHEWFIRHGAPAGLRESDLFEGLGDAAIGAPEGE